MSFQLGNAIGEKENLNTEEKYVSFIGQGIWPKPGTTYLFKNKGNFVYNFKLKKYKHMSETPVHYEFRDIQSIKKDLWKHALK